MRAEFNRERLPQKKMAPSGETAILAFDEGNKETGAPKGSVCEVLDKKIGNVVVNSCDRSEGDYFGGDAWIGPLGMPFIFFVAARRTRLCSVQNTNRNALDRTIFICVKQRNVGESAPGKK